MENEVSLVNLRWPASILDILYQACYLSICIRNFSNSFDIICSQLDSVFLTESLVLLNADGSVPREVKLVKNIRESCMTGVSVAGPQDWRVEMFTSVLNLNLFYLPHSVIACSPCHSQPSTGLTINTIMSFSRPAKIMRFHTQYYHQTCQHSLRASWRMKLLVEMVVTILCSTSTFIKGADAESNQDVIIQTP